MKTIVKVSRSTFPNGNNFLIYNEIKKVWWQTTIEKSPYLADLLGNEQKAFFYAQVTGNQVEIKERAPKQDW